MPAILRSHPLFFEALVDAHIYSCVRILKDRFLLRPSAPYSGREGVSPYCNACAAISALVLDNSLDELLHKRNNPYAFADQGPACPFYNHNDALPRWALISPPSNHISALSLMPCISWRCSLSHWVAL